MYSNVMRMTGIYSGMDTASMVTQLMNAETMKYTKLLQQRQKVEWQQEAYRSVATSLSDFRQNYLYIEGANSIYKNSTFNTIVASVTSGGKESSAIKVSASSSSEVGEFSVEVIKAAKSASYESKRTPTYSGSKSVDESLDGAVLSTSDTFSVSLDGGADFKFSFTEAEIEEINGLTGEEKYARIESLINDKLATRFGYSYKDNPDYDPAATEGTESEKYIKDESSPKVSVSIDRESGIMSFNSAAGYSAEIKAGGTAGTDLLGKLGFDEGGNTAYDTKKKLSDLIPGLTGESEVIINGTAIKVDASDTIEQFMSKVNSSSAGVTMTFDKMRSTFEIKSKTTGVGSSVKDVEDSSGILSALGFNDSNGDGELDGGTAGVNAEFIYNGTRYSRESNYIELESVEIILSEEAEGSEFNIGVSRDITKPMEAIKKFVEEYNNLIDVIIGHTNTTRAKSGKYDFYEPLTDDQKAEMSEKEIEKWEEKAKTGLLYRDSILSGINQQMRSMMYTPVELEDGSKIALYQIGITTSGASKNAGKLQIDEDALTEMLENNPYAVEQLFAKPAETMASSVSERKARMQGEGLAMRLTDIIDNAIEFGGSIRDKAGIEGTSSAFDNLLYDQLSDYNDKITSMLDYLEKKETQYYNMFSRMEQAMSQSNNQMSAITSMLGGQQ